MNLNSVFREFNGRLSEFGSVVIAGGAVRDFLMSQVPKDYDVFVLQGPNFDFDKATKEIPKKLSDLESTPLEIDWHNSEPFLIATVTWEGVKVQILVNPSQSPDELISTFDWNVCLFAFDGNTFFGNELIENIGYGKDLVLQKTTFPLSTLRRGFRFSERFKMKFPYLVVVALCQKIVENYEKGLHKGPVGNEPDMKALGANTLVDDDINF